jgi:tetratricopeptide (TPR) repeat protein
LTDRLAKLQAMVEAEPSDPFSLYGLAMEFAKLGRTSEALAMFDRTIQADRSYCYAYFHKAKCQEQAGDASGAVVTLAMGLQEARAVRDAKATNEIAAYLDELT